MSRPHAGRLAHRPMIARRRAAAALAVALAALAGSGLGAACHHDAAPAVQPVGPDEPPPLPPASGSPIGFLLDDTRLSLRDDQRTQLHAIDQELAGKLSYLDNVLRNTGSATEPAQADSHRGGVGFGASRQTNGSDDARLSAHDSPGSPSSGAISAQAAADNAAIRRRVPEVRAHDVRAAIERAFGVLDPAQRDTARKVLVERGIDPETGRFQAQGDPGVVGRDPGSASPDPVK